jgi:hypothetical protein
MKRVHWFLAMCLVAALPVWAHPGQTSEQPPQTGQQEHAAEGERPTLGPAPAPTLGGGGPGTATVNDARKLIRIRTLYVERIDNELSDKLVEELGKSGRFRIVTKARDADATVRGSCLESRRLKMVHSEIFITDRAGASVWQDNIKRPYRPPTLDKAVSETAALVAGHLEESIREASRK